MLKFWHYSHEQNIVGVFLSAYFKMKYRPDIDGLRAIAVALVVLYHAFPTLVPSGFIGVDVFFVISGFLITKNILGDLNLSKFSFFDFYSNRVRRILPALVAVLLAAWFIGLFGLDADVFERLGHHLIGATTFTSNFILWNESGYFEPSTAARPLLHLWSLAIEEQFYVFWPVLLLLAWKAKVPRIFTGISLIVSLGWCAYSAAETPTANFYLLLSRAWELLSGCFVAQFSVRDFARSRVLAFFLDSLAAVFLVAGLVFCTRDEYPGAQAVLPVLASVAFLMRPASGWINRLMGHRFLSSFGKVSYPLYLWHWPLLTLLIASYREEPSTLAKVGVIAGSIALSYITYYFVELRAQNSRWLADKWLLIGSGSLAAIAALGFCTQRGMFFTERQRSELVFTNYSHLAADWGKTGCWLGNPEHSIDQFALGCLDQVDKSKKALLVWGDSYATRLVPGFKVFGEAKGLEILNIGASQCPPILGFVWTNNVHCPMINQFVFNQIQARHIKIIVMEANWLALPATQAVADQMKATFQALFSVGVEKIVVFGQVAVWSSPLPKVIVDFYLDEPKLPERSRFKLMDGLLPRENFIRDVVAQDKRVSFIGLQKVFCSEYGCLLTVGSNLATDLVTFDQGHLTDSASTFAVKAVEGELTSYLKR